METGKNVNFNLIAGALFALRGLYLLSVLVGYFSVWTLLWMAGYVLAAVMLFMGRKDILSALGFGWMTLLSVHDVIVYSNKFVELLYLLAFGAMTLIVVAVLTSYLPGLHESARTLWFVPAALYALSSIINIGSILFSGYFPVGYIFRSFLLSVVGVAGLLMTGLWAASFEGLPFGQFKSNPGHYEQSTGGRPAANQSVPEAEGYCDIAKHVLLLLLTCGIWNLIWIYRMTGYLNRVEDEPPRDPTTKLLLCMFVPFYSIYWIYKSAQRIDKLAAARGVPSDLSTLCLILAIFVAIVPPIIMQDKVNAIIKAGPNAGPQAPSYAPPAQSRPSPNMGAADELLKYKSLLDSGVITQEEFEAKKKQLLGL